MSRSVVTGLGAVTPLGIGADAYWSALLAGRVAFAPITRFVPASYPARLAGEVRDFVVAEHVPSRVIPQTDHGTHLGLAATQLALADAEVEPKDLPEYEMAVVTAASSGGTEFGQREMVNLWGKGPGFVGAYQSIAWFYAATTGQISIRHGLRGHNGVIATEQAGGLDALAQSTRLVRGGARIVVSGGADASLCPYGLVAQLSTGRLSTRTDPLRAYLPFDTDACGYVPGEGGGLLVVEDHEHAVARNAPRIYGEVSGYGATFDPPPGSGRDSTFTRAIEKALRGAGIGPAEVDVVFADAVGVPELDSAEAAALVAVFGPRGVPVTAPKTMIGRLYAGGAALDVIAALLAIRDSVLPPTAGVTDPIEGLDLTLGGPRRARVRHALVVARGHGGFNSALVVSAIALSGAESAGGRVARPVPAERSSRWRRWSR